MNRAKKNGFTLVEVLVVIAVIAVLAALILGLAGHVQKSAARKRAAAEITQLDSFITDHLTKYGKVPADKAALTSALVAENHARTNLIDPWGMEYEYTPSSQVTYYLWSQGGSTRSVRSMFIGNPP